MESTTRIYVAVGLATLAMVFLAVAGAWPFDSVPIRLDSSPSLWQLLLADRLTLGFLRLAILAVTGYLVTSIVAQMAQNRWITRFSSSGLSTEEAGKAAKTVGVQAKQIEQLNKEREHLLQLLDVDRSPQEGTIVEPEQEEGAKG